MANPQKRKRSSTDIGISTTPVKRANMRLTGPAFVQGIANITGGGSAPVETAVSIPLVFGTLTNRKNNSLSLHATFSGKDHNPSVGTHGWTQGWMDMGGQTSYEKVIPDTLGVKQARVESRVMKNWRWTTPMCRKLPTL